MKDDHYVTLNVPRTASIQEIKQQYISLSLRYHPDRNETGSQMFIDIQRAWETLRDDSLRKKYDKELYMRDNDLKRLKGEVTEIVKLSDMELNENGILLWPCRCSSHYEVDNEFFHDNTRIIVNCSGCSLKIQVENDLD
jgi:diphthamide biosynthesis protein 4